MKNMMKALLAISLALLLALFAFAAEGTESNVSRRDGVVEISFKVGDDTLLINGNEVTVEKPYVVEVENIGGVTLVPLRVITEAFGAKVDWEDETRKIFLSYEDTEIELQIGNIIAKINGREQELLTAPVISTDRTMVPLRFISENFGAEVSYDDATKAISVIKGGIKEFSSDKFAFSLTFPESYVKTGYFDEKENVFDFIDVYTDTRGTSRVTVKVYSVSDDLSLDEIVDKTYENFENILNEDVITLSPLSKKSYENFEAYEIYFRAASELYARSGSYSYSFFERGGYIYEIDVYAGPKEADADKMIASVLNSFNAKELKAGDAGEYPYDGVAAADGGSGVVEINGVGYVLPSSFKKVSETQYTDSKTSVTAIFFASELPDEEFDLQKYAEYIVRSMAVNGYSISVPAEERLIGDREFWFFEGSVSNNGGKIYTLNYLTAFDENVLCMVAFNVSQASYSSNVKQMLEDIASSLGAEVTK